MSDLAAKELICLAPKARALRWVPDEHRVAARADPERLAVERVDGKRGGIPVLESGAVEMSPRGTVT